MLITGKYLYLLNSQLGNNYILEYLRLLLHKMPQKVPESNLSWRAKGIAKRVERRSVFLIQLEQSPRDPVACYADSCHFRILRSQS